jgi:hypothetical protein
VDGFLVNFLANLASDAILGILVYFAITQPGEKKRLRASIRQALGLLKSETETNVSRARAYVRSFDSSDADISALFPLRYTRGAWNALKESGFLSRLDNARLVYYLLRMNEAMLVANKNLRRLQLAFLEKTGGNRKLLARTVRQDAEHLLEAMSQVLAMLNTMDLPRFSVEHTYGAQEILEMDDSEDEAHT